MHAMTFDSTTVQQTWHWRLMVTGANAWGIWALSHPPHRKAPPFSQTIFGGGHHTPMSPVSIPLPASQTFLKSVKQSCRVLRVFANVKINTSSIERFLRSGIFARLSERRSGWSNFALPLKFPSILSELNVLSILALLNFDSEYREPLYEVTGRGVPQSVRAFVLSLYVSSSIGGEGNLLSARGLQNITDVKVADLLGANIHVERPHETLPGVTVGEIGGPLLPFVKLISKTLREAGEALVTLGYPDLGTFVLESLKEGEKAHAKSGTGADVEVVLERLVRAIPGFQDVCDVYSQPTYCFRKALYLIYAIKVRFGQRSPPPLPIPSTLDIPAFADNAIASLLIHLGIIDVSGSSALSQLFPDVNVDDLISILNTTSSQPDLAIHKKDVVITTEQSCIMRAAAVDACENIIDLIRQSTWEGEGSEQIQSITPPEFSAWLGSLAES